ncbi:hypothetical protein NRIC_33850 [Enterococcus florum]|uniref:Uncharacterized protein n=1 Tax=Enterococcus florum TaxID=2480627 RepID=A0A4P5PFG1_9ENTE|nr:hypothetical protein [Enterococcus florum]GCF95494.1 hypothetical protein NRIC_33850 [Enterococcus florum]
MKNQRTYGEPSPAMLFIFTMLTIMFYGVSTGFFDTSALLLLGVIQLGCFPAYLIGAITYLVKGDSINGNVFLIFATAFGGIGGGTNIVNYFMTTNGNPLDGRILGVVWLWCGLSVIPIVCGMLNGPLMPLIVFSVGAIQLIMSGLFDLGILPDFFQTIIHMCYLIIAFGGFYCSLASLFGFSKIHVPLGKPLIAKKKEELFNE